MDDDKLFGKFALTVAYNLDIFQLAYNFFQSYYPLNTDIFI